MKSYKINNRTTIKVMKFDDEFQVIVRNNGKMGKGFCCDFDYLCERYKSIKNELIADFGNEENQNVNFRIC